MRDDIAAVRRLVIAAIVTSLASAITTAALGAAFALGTKPGDILDNVHATQRILDRLEARVADMDREGTEHMRRKLLEIEREMIRIDREGSRKWKGKAPPK